MAKNWYRIEQHRVAGIVHVQRMSGYHIVAQAQLYTDQTYTDAEIIALVDAIEPQALNYGATDLDRKWVGFADCYNKVREPDAADFTTLRLGGLPTDAEQLAQWQQSYERAMRAAGEI